MKTIFAILVAIFATVGVSHAEEICESIAEFAGYAVKARFLGVTEDAFLAIALANYKDPDERQFVREVTSAAYNFNTQGDSPEVVRAKVEMVFYAECLEAIK